MEEPAKRTPQKGESSLCECADFIFPWLHPSELASLALTCKSLNLIAKSITNTRSADASRNLEKLRIPFFNAVDDHPYCDFFYTPSQVLAIRRDPTRFRQPWGGRLLTRPDIRRVGSQPTDYFPVRVEGASGCGCKRCDEDSDCPCWLVKSSELRWECGPSCRCGLECGNRVTQGGIEVQLKIVKDGKKGWGVHAGEPIQEGQFVCEYAGELLTTGEARKRQQVYDELTGHSQFSPALLVVREHLPSGNSCLRINIDATRIGNVARFINHSCDGGNLLTTLVRCSGAVLPRLCLFTSRFIRENEELTFSYGDVRIRSKGLQCFCGSPSCFGTLPSEHT